MFNPPVGLSSPIPSGLPLNLEQNSDLSTGLVSTYRLSTKEAFLGNDYVEDDVLKSAEPLLRELGRVKASKYATKVRLIFALLAQPCEMERSDETSYRRIE